MKINPVDLVVNNKSIEGINFFFISGNEVTFIDKIKQIIVSKVREKKSVRVDELDNIQHHINEVSLFEDKIVYFIKDTKGLEKDIINDLVNTEDIFIISSKNSPKNSKLKKEFINNRKLALIDCYEISRDDKIKLIKDFSLKYKITIAQDIFWFLVDVLDNKYVFFEKELEKISKIGANINDIDGVKKIISTNPLDSGRIFFDIFKNNQEIVRSYNKDVQNTAELNLFFYSIKNYLLLVLQNLEEREFSQKIPRYLFKEKPILLKIFKKITDEKRGRIQAMLLKTEVSFRKNERLSIIIGLRFFLNLKKIIIS